MMDAVHLSHMLRIDPASCPAASPFVARLTGALLWDGRQDGVATQPPKERQRLEPPDRFNVWPVVQASTPADDPMSVRARDNLRRSLAELFAAMMGQLEAGGQADALAALSPAHLATTTGAGRQLILVAHDEAAAGEIRQHLAMVAGALNQVAPGLGCASPFTLSVELDDHYDMQFWRYWPDASCGWTAQKAEARLLQTLERITRDGREPYYAERLRRLHARLYGARPTTSDTEQVTTAITEAAAAQEKETTGT